MSHKSGERTEEVESGRGTWTERSGGQALELGYALRMRKESREFGDQEVGEVPE